jgi:hypothetical protein
MLLAVIAVKSAGYRKKRAARKPYGALLAVILHGAGLAGTLYVIRTNLAPQNMTKWACYRPRAYKVHESG